MKKKFILYKIFFFLLLVSTSLYSQDQINFESFKNIEAIKEQDTTKVNLYILLAKKYLNEQILDSAFLVANKGLFLAKKLDYTYAIGELYAIHGDIKVVQNELFQALDYYMNSVEYMKEEKYKGKLANILLVIGNIHVAQANYPKALEFYQKGLLIADSLNYVSMIVHFYNNLGELYYSLGQWEDAINNYMNALEIYLDNNDDIGQASIYSSLSIVYLKMDNIEQARTNVEQAFDIYNKSSDNGGLLHAYSSMAAIERKENNFIKAISYYKKGLEHFKKMGIEYKGPKSILEVDLYKNIGFCSIQIKNYRQAEENLLKGYEIALKNGQLSALEDISLFLSDLYDITGNKTKAFYYYREHDAYSDSLSHEENIKKITQLEMQFEFDKKNRQRELEQAQKDSIQKRKELIYIMISSSIFLAMLILFLLLRLQKNKITRIRLERKNLMLDLDFKNKELTTNVMYLLKKNEFIESISAKLKSEKQYFKPENRAFIDSISKELESSLSKDAWEEFEVRFQQVHSGFYQKLTNRYPDLSPNDLKLCAFLRLNMSTKDIASITYQSYNTLSTARYRLRKKLGLDDHANLINFLNQL